MHKKKKDRLLERDIAFHSQFKKTKRALTPVGKADSKPQHMVGVARPLATDFKQLQERALQTPMLDDKVDERTDLDFILSRHTRVTNYSSNYLLAVTVLCCLRDREFFWYVQTIIVSKASGKNVLNSLLGKRELEAMRKGFREAMNGVGDLDNVREIKMKDARVWEVPFLRADYEFLLGPFRALTIYPVGATGNETVCAHCGIKESPFGAFALTTDLQQLACSPDCLEALENKV